METPMRPPLAPRRGTLILVASLALAAHAAAAPQDESGGAAEARGRAHLVHLVDGRVLRVDAREESGTWEVRRGREWIALPEGAVERAVPERDLLRQSRRLESELDGDPVRRVAYGDWLVREGLYAEALAELDRVLKADPDQPHALALVRRAELPVALPTRPGERAPGAAVEASAPETPEAREEALERFLRTAAGAGPAVREICVERLRRLPETPGRPGLVERLAAELTDRNRGRRSFATLALRRLFPGREVRPLLASAILDASEEVRVGASLALRDVGDEAVILPALRALGSKNDRVRANAIGALGAMGYPAAVEPLIAHLAAIQSGGGGGTVPHSHVFVGRQIAYISDYDVEVAQFSAIADPQVNVLIEGAVLDAGVIGVTQYVAQTERANTRRALAQLTGAEPGYTVAAWQSWWEEHGDEWRAGRTPSGPTTSSSSPDR
jgi:hypothetical protein